MEMLYWTFLVSFSFIVLYTITHKQRPVVTNGWLKFFNISGQLSAEILILLYIVNIPNTPRLFFASGFLIYFIFMLMQSFEMAFKLNVFEEKNPSEGDEDGEWIVILIFGIIFGVMSLFFLFNWSYSIIKWGGWLIGVLILFLAIYELTEVKRKDIAVIANLISEILLALSLFLIGYYVDDSLNSSYHDIQLFTDTHFKLLNDVLFANDQSIWIKLLFWIVIVAILLQVMRISKNSKNQIKENPRKEIRKKQPKETSNQATIKTQTTVIPKRIVNDIDKLSTYERKLFYKYFFSLMGKISAIDGNVSNEEIKTVESMMKIDLNLSGRHLRLGKNIFINSQSDKISHEALADDFKKCFPENHNINIKLIESLLRVAYSDGSYDENEEEFIKSICRILDISNEEYVRLKTQYYFEMMIIKLLNAMEYLRNTDNILEIKRQLNILFDSIHSPFLVTILGEFSTGKSTFINALINKNLLAMKIRPTTATITKLHYGNENKLEVMYNDGSIKIFDKTDLHALTVESYVDEKDIMHDIHYVSLTVDEELLRNIDIADTPGFNSNNAHHTKITSNFIAYADAVIWLFDANQMAKKSTFDLINEYCKYEKPIGIINKIDQIDEDEREEIIQDLIKTLEPHTNSVFAISSKMAIDQNDDKRERSGINSVRDYFIKAVIPSAVKNKSKIILIKLIQIIILLNEEKRHLVDWINKFEKKIDQHEADSDKYDERLKNHNYSAEKFENDMANEEVTYYDILNNMDKYFIGRKIPETINDKTKNLISNYESLEKNNVKINKWGSNIDENEVALENDLNGIEIRWKKYNWSFLGGKSLLDSLLGDVTSEKKNLNRDSAIWDKKRDEWSDEIDNYNEFLKKTNEGWERLNTSLINFVDDLSNKVFENANEIDKEGERLTILYDQLVKDNDLYEEKLEYNQIFERDILKISNEISQLFDIKTNQGKIQAFDDFETLINNLKRQQIKHKKLGDKKVYHREKISEVISVGKKDSVYISNDKKYSNNLQENAPKIT